MPIERGAKYEDPLDELLRQHRLGEVTGGGTGLTKDHRIDYVGIDIDVVDVSRALPLIQRKLREIGAPKGTIIEETQEERVRTHPVW
jgi:hypothetical protein